MSMFVVRTRPRVRSLIACASLLAPGWIACSTPMAVDPGMLPSSTTSTPTAGTGTAGVGSAVPAAGSSAGATALATAGMVASTAGGTASAGTVASSAAGATAGSGASGSAAAGSGGAAAAAGSSGSSGVAAGSGGVSGAAGSSGAAAGGGGSSATHEDLGKGDGSDVVLLGDSYMSNTLQFEGTGGGIVPSLLRVSGQRYRNYAVQGTMLLMDNSFGRAIPTQWDGAKRADADIKTVVMTGGGNDIIQSDAMKASCMAGGADCKALLIKETMRFDMLWTQMAESGVKDIIHVAYATDGGTVSSTLLSDPAVAAIPPICTSGKVRCHRLDTTALVKGERAVDDIHPLESANNRMAQAIVDLMMKEGIRR